MMKTVQAIIHCSDRVVILVHAEGDVGQSPWQVRNLIFWPVMSQQFRETVNTWCLCNIFWQARKRNWSYGNPSREKLQSTVCASVQQIKTSPEDSSTVETLQQKPSTETNYRDRSKYKTDCHQHVRIKRICVPRITVNPLYLANLANLTFSLIFKDAKLKRRQQYFSTLK